MSNILTQPKLQTDADYEAIVRQLLAEMSRIEEQMDRTSADSERLKLEIQVIKATTEAKLIRLEELVSNLSKAN